VISLITDDNDFDRLQPRRRSIDEPRVVDVRPDSAIQRVASGNGSLGRIDTGESTVRSGEPSSTVYSSHSHRKSSSDTSMMEEEPEFNYRTPTSSIHASSTQNDGPQDTFNETPRAGPQQPQVFRTISGGSSRSASSLEKVPELPQPPTLPATLPDPIRLERLQTDPEDRAATAELHHNTSYIRTVDYEQARFCRLQTDPECQPYHPSPTTSPRQSVDPASKPDASTGSSPLPENAGKAQADSQPDMKVQGATRKESTMEDQYFMEVANAQTQEATIQRRKSVTMNHDQLAQSHSKYRKRRADGDDLETPGCCANICGP